VKEKMCLYKRFLGRWADVLEMKNDTGDLLLGRREKGEEEVASSSPM